MPQSAAHASPRAQRDYCGYLQVITYYQQSIAQLYQFTFKKLQISFVQNAKTLIN